VTAGELDKGEGDGLSKATPDSLTSRLGFGCKKAPKLGRIRKTGVRNNPFVPREGLPVARSLNQFRKAVADEVPIFPHAKPHFRRDESLAPNLECAPRPVLKQFRQF
jgi:hypothetical protein